MVFAVHVLPCSTVDGVMMVKTSMPYILKRSKQEFSGKKSLGYIKHFSVLLCRTVCRTVCVFLIAFTYIAFNFIGVVICRLQK